MCAWVFNLRLKFWGGFGLPDSPWNGVSLYVLYIQYKLPLCIVQFFLLTVLFIYSPHCVQSPSSSHTVFFIFCTMYPPFTVQSPSKTAEIKKLYFHTIILNFIMRITETFMLKLGCELLIFDFWFPSNRAPLPLRCVQRSGCGTFLPSRKSIKELWGAILLEEKWEAFLRNGRQRSLRNNDSYSTLDVVQLSASLIWPHNI